MNTSISSMFQRTVRGAILAAVAGAALSLTPAASAQNTVSNRTVTNSSNGESSVRVESQNGRYTITLDGKEVKSGSLSDVWTTFDLVNENGESVGVVTREGDDFGVALDGEMPALRGLGHVGSDHMKALMAERDAQRAGAAAGRGIARAYVTTPGQWGGPQPRVMLGVTLDSPGEALSAQLGIDRENSTILSTLTSGLPAEKAGLKIYDVIIEVDGEPASPDTLRRFLREKNAGETLALKVVSAAVRKDVTVTLEAYDASRLNTYSGSWAPGVATTGGTFTLNGFDEQMEEKARELEKLGQLLAEKSIAIQNAGTDNKALEALSEQMNKLGEEMNKRGEEMNKLGEEMARANTGGWNIFPGGAQGGSRTIVGRRSGGGGDTIFRLPSPVTPPTAPTTPGTPSGVAVLDTNEAAAIKERMDKMDQRLAQLIALMEISAKNQGTAPSGGSPKKDN